MAYELIPQAAEYLATWIVGAAGVVLLVKMLMPMIRSINAAVSLINEQLQHDSGNSLLDKVDDAKQSADMALKKIEEHIQQHHE